MNNPTITILGSCRQESLYKKYNITSIQEELSYPQYSKEVLEVLNYCLFDNLTPQQTMIFRTPVLNNQPIQNNPFLNEIEKSDIIFIEIASKKYYKYKNLYHHHYQFFEYFDYDDNETLQEKYNRNEKEVETGVQEDEEIIKDLNKIVELLPSKKIIFVGHLVTKKQGDRYDLLTLTKNFCLENNILFIDPMEELLKNDFSVDELVSDADTIFAHYTRKGHEEILKVYEKYINI
tara:strand:- start:2358 stop:3059 length:702 start_codon:yes stop_codon:yes gene_type:complete